MAKGALAFTRLARTARTALVDGDIGIVVVSGGRIRTVLTFAFNNDRIAEIDVIAHPTQLANLDVRLINQ